MMRNALLASTALVAMSGAAFAQGVNLSGSAEMGVADDGRGDARFHQDVDVTFKMSAMTDTGLTFGVAVDLDEDAGAVGTDDKGVAASIGGPFGNVTLGDTDGGFDWAMAEVGGAGAIADDHTAHKGFSGNSGLDGAGDGQILRYDNMFGDLGVALSFEQNESCGLADSKGMRKDDTGDACTADGMSGDTIGVGVKGSFGDFSVGVGWQGNDVHNIAGASLTATFGGINGAFNYSTKSYDANDDSDKHMGVGATYTSGDITVNVNFGQMDKSGMKDTGFGVAAQYAMGGGANLRFGYGNSQLADDSEMDTWSLGVAVGF